MRVTGFVSVLKVLGPDGKVIDNNEVVERGWVKPCKKIPTNMGVGKNEIPVGYNDMVDNGRQAMAYLFGGKAPTASYRFSRFGLGTSDLPTNPGMSNLAAPLDFYNLTEDPLLPYEATKPIDSVDYPAPYIAQVTYTISGASGNPIYSAIIKEQGLFSFDGTTPILLCREVTGGIELPDGVSKVMLWRIAF